MPRTASGRLIAVPSRPSVVIPGIYEKLLARARETLANGDPRCDAIAYAAERAEALRSSPVVKQAKAEVEHLESRKPVVVARWQVVTGSERQQAIPLFNRRISHYLSTADDRVSPAHPDEY